MCGEGAVEAAEGAACGIRVRSGADVCGKVGEATGFGRWVVGMVWLRRCDYGV